MIGGADGTPLPPSWFPRQPISPDTTYALASITIFLSYDQNSARRSRTVRRGELLNGR